MVSFLRNWIQGIAMAVILASIFEMLLPNGNLKKYIKVVLGLYIVFSIISPFVNRNELYSFDVIKEVDKYASSSVKSTAEIKDNIEEMYIETFEKKLKTVVQEQGYNVRSCLVDAVFEGKEDDIGIKKILLVLSSKNSNFYSKDDSSNDIEPIEKVTINVGISNPQKDIQNEITSGDMENLKNYLAEYLNVKKNIIDIQNY